MEDSLSCGALCGDFNQGIHQLDAIQKEFIVCQTALPQMPVGILDASETDVTGGLLPPRSRPRQLRLSRHGQIRVHLPDLGVRRADTGCHWPNIVVHNLLSPRTRSDAAQQIKKEQKAAKAKAATRWARTSYIWSYDPFKWHYKCVTGVRTPTSGAITLPTIGRGPLCISLSICNAS